LTFAHDVSTFEEMKRIGLVSIQNYKRVEDITITPDEDTIIMIAGENAQGKTSVMDGIEAVLGGKDAVVSDPVRHGTEEAVLLVKLVDDDPKVPPLVARRVITKEGKVTFEVRDELGAIKAPQTALGAIIGARLLDPLGWIRKSPNDQLDALLQVIDKERRLPQLDEGRERVFKRRTEINRDHDKAKAELERTPAGDIPAMVDVAALSARLKEAHTTIAEGESVKVALRDRTAQRDSAAAKVNAIEAEIARTRELLAHLEKALVVAKSDHTDAIDEASRVIEAAAEMESMVRRARIERDELQQSLQTANAVNDKHAQAVAIAKRREVVAKEVEAYGAEAAKLTAKIVEIDAERAAIFERGKLPIDGLTVDGKVIMYNGVPFSQASRAETYKVAIGLAVAQRSELRDIWIRDGAVLDDSTIALFRKIAAETGYRFWIERVGKHDPGALLIHEGRVAGRTPSDPAAPVAAQRSLFE
jgi:hypothetical protein